MIYTEEYLMSQFTFGFEFEGFSFSDEDYINYQKLVQKYFDSEDFKKDKSVVSKGYNLGDDSSIDPFEERPCRTCDGEQQITCPDCNGDGTDDDGEECDNCNGSGWVNCPDCEDVTTHELASPAFKFTPKNIEKAIQFLTEAFAFTHTNKSCSLHIHIGFPEKLFKIDENRVWVMFCLANDTKKVSEISNFHEFELFDEHYAPIDYLFRINEHMKRLQSNMDLVTLVNYVFTNRKFLAFGQHSQGTLEWRGPRGFLDEKVFGTVRDFFIKQLYPFVKWIGKTLEMESITTSEGYKIERKTVFDIISKADKRISNAPKTRRSPFAKRFTSDVDFSLLPEVVKKHKSLLTSSFLCISIKKTNTDLFNFTFAGAVNLTINNCMISGSNIMGGHYSNVILNSNFNISNKLELHDCVIGEFRKFDYYFNSENDVKMYNCQVNNTHFDNCSKMWCVNSKFNSIEIEDMVNCFFHVCDLNINFINYITDVNFSHCNIIVNKIGSDSQFKNVNFINCMVTTGTTRKAVNGIYNDIKEFKKDMGITNENDWEET